MMKLSEIIASRKLRQKDAAELFGATQPRIKRTNSRISTQTKRQ